MNYFTHGREFLDRPYFVAGTALPDWLNVVNRRVRLRRKRVEPFLRSIDPIQQEIAAGVIQHHTDDDWFHRTRAFAELSLQFAVSIRDQLPKDDGLRPSFLGHILVELLLDDYLAQRDPKRLSTYYACLENIEPPHVVDFVRRVTGRDAEELAVFIPRFLQVRFLYDYAEDAKLLYRLNQVMQRVGLAKIPDAMAGLLPRLRAAVQQRATELLTRDVVSGEAP
jgi:hypothetical protein